MNKDKVIKDLKERNNILSNQYMQEQTRNYNLNHQIEQLKEKVEYLKNKIENKDRWCQLIADIGYDYDGFNKVNSLKGLIDELVRYALYSRDNYDYLEWLKEDNKDGNNE